MVPAGISVNLPVHHKPHNILFRHIWQLPCKNVLQPYKPAITAAPMELSL